MPDRGLKRKQPDPLGRLDILASRVLGELAERVHNPAVRALYSEFQGELERELRRYLGLRNRHARKVREFVINGRRILQAQAKARAAQAQAKAQAEGRPGV